MRFVHSSERIVSKNAGPNVFYRGDMPGHVRHTNGDTFESVWLDDHDYVPVKEFDAEVPPDGKLWSGFTTR